MQTSHVSYQPQLYAGMCPWAHLDLGACIACRLCQPPCSAAGWPRHQQLPAWLHGKGAGTTPEGTSQHSPHQQDSKHSTCCWPNSPRLWQPSVLWCCAGQPDMHPQRVAAVLQVPGHPGSQQQPAQRPGGASRGHGLGLRVGPEASPGCGVTNRMQGHSCGPVHSVE